MRFFMRKWGWTIVIFGSRNQWTCWMFWWHFVSVVMLWIWDEFVWFVREIATLTFSLLLILQFCDCQEVHLIRVEFCWYYVFIIIVKIVISLVNIFTHFIMPLLETTLSIYYLNLIHLAQFHFICSTLTLTFHQSSKHNKNTFSTHLFRTHLL